MKPTGPVLLAPSATGWRAFANGTATDAPDLAAAAAAIPADAPLHIALPTDGVLVERMRLPSTDRDELAAMVQLQLEKIVPFPIDEVSSDFVVLSEKDGESQVLALCAHHGALDKTCEPLQRLGRWPDRVSFYAQHIAATLGDDRASLAIVREPAGAALILAKGGKLLNARPTDAAALSDEIPAFLLECELAGLPVDVAAVQLESGLDLDALTFLPGVPVLPFDASAVPATATCDFLPPSWKAERKRAARGRDLRKKLIGAGIVWALLAVTVAGWIVFLQAQLAAVEKKIASVQDDLDFVASRQSRWLALAPAIDPSRYPVDILRELHACIPSPEIRFTRFSVSGGGFQIEGEAPTVAAAVEYAERVKSSEGLSAFQITAPNPTILPNEHGQFRIFGKP